MIPCQKVFQLSIMFLIILCETRVFGVHPRGTNAPPVKCVEKDRQALLTFKEGLRGNVTNTQFSSWGTKEIQKDCCKWEGVHCNNQTGNVIGLDLIGFNKSAGFLSTEALSGVISSSLLELKYLEHLGFKDFNFSSPIPVFFGSFSRLKYLSLTSVEFEGRIPRELGNLSSLHTLDLGVNYNLSSDNLEWLLSLQSLRNLYLSHVDLSKATDWLKYVNSLPLLEALYLSYCQLPRVSSSSIEDYVNSSRSLSVLDISSNNLSSSVYTWIFNYSSSLTYIELSDINLEGIIPSDFAKMVPLEDLDLSYNNLEGGIPSSFSNCSSLQSLSLSGNNIMGDISELMKNLSGRVSSTLRFLDLNLNLFSGSLSNLAANFSSLTALLLANNLLTRIEIFGHLSSLEMLDLSSNHLEGVISEFHMLNFSQLEVLDFSSNSNLEVRFDSDWIPPFQLSALNFRGCKIGPHFPRWLQTQNQIIDIDMSRNGISGNIPNWLRNQMSQFTMLNFSYNLIGGTLPKLNTYWVVDLSSNNFEGLIPQFSKEIQLVNLSKNRFSGKITTMCNSSYESLRILDLSDNQFFGQLPDCWGHFGSLIYLNLANNNFSGKIPYSLGTMRRIEVIQLRNNSFTDQLPQSWKASELLKFIDFGENKLSSAIPSWIGSNLPNLVVLSLSSNNFSGNIPEQICYLSKIQILDLSRNNIFGPIPRCISNFSVMTQEGSSPKIKVRYIGIYFQVDADMNYAEEAFLIWKGRESRYKSTIWSVKIIDLSSNNLSGGIPLEVTALIGLLGLNLSRNHLTGILTPQIGKLKSLDSLDLSRNQLSGEIPSSLSQLSLLGVLNLSFNNLTGRIPSNTRLQTYEASSFQGNPGLCGSPLPQACPEGTNVLDNEENEDKLITAGFHLSMALGFILGFWGVCGTLFFNRSCRHSFFRILNEIRDWFYGITSLKLARLQRRLQG